MRTKLLSRLASEAAFAVPAVMLMTTAALAIAGVAVTASISGQGGTVRDQQTKNALAVAESGVSQALLQFNRYGLTSAAAPCAPVGGTVPDAEGWCPQVTGATVNGGTVTYWAKPSSSPLPGGGLAWTDLELVAVGAFGETTRRVNVSASSSSGQDMFVDAAVKSKDGIVLDSNAEIHAGAATNGNITMGSNAKQCGVASVGIGKELKGGGYYTDTGCVASGGEPLEDEISLPPVNQGNAPVENFNYRLFSEDKITGNKNTACFNGLSGNGKADKSCGLRELTIGSNSAVTLGGGVYSFCRLALSSNSSLYVAEGANVTIYFDSPEACNYESGATQLELNSNSRITAAKGKSVDLAMLFVGSPTRATNIILNSETAVDGPCEQNFVIYAPYTDVEFDSNTRFCGAVAGKTVHLDSEAQAWTSAAVTAYVLPNTAPHYESERFVDCAATVVAGSPDAGC